MLLNRFYDPREERSRFSNALEYFDEVDDGVRVFDIVQFISSGEIIDLKRPSTKNHRVSITNGSVLYHNWELMVGTGPYKSDQIKLLGAITLPDSFHVRYEIQFPKEPWYGRRERIVVTDDVEQFEFECDGTERLWQIAGRQDVYDDPSWWWVIVDANPGLNGIVRNMLKPVPRGTVLIIPVESEVLVQLLSAFE